MKQIDAVRLDRKYVYGFNAETLERQLQAIEG